MLLVQRLRPRLTPTRICYSLFRVFRGTTELCFGFQNAIKAYRKVQVRDHSVPLMLLWFPSRILDRFLLFSSAVLRFATSCSHFPGELRSAHYTHREFPVQLRWFQRKVHRNAISRRKLFANHVAHFGLLLPIARSRSISRTCAAFHHVSDHQKCVSVKFRWCSR